MVIKENIPVVINSKQRLNPTDLSSNFTWTFNDDINRITEILIKSVQIPYSYYNVNATNNTLNINGVPVVIPHGNYTVFSIMSVLENAIDGVLGNNTTVSYSDITLKFTISSDINIQIFTDSNTVNSPLSILLGFRQDSVSATTLIGDSVVYLGGTNYINIVSSFITRPIHNKTIYRDNDYKDVLVSVPVNSIAGGIITYTPEAPVKLSYKFKINNNAVIDFRLEDEDGNILNLNGLDWSMQLFLVTE